MNRIFQFFLVISLLFNFACLMQEQPASFTITGSNENVPDWATPKPILAEIQSPEIKNLLASAVEQTNLTKFYDPAYVELPYPNGDIPIEKGVCTDVVIRAFRKAGVDLQKEVHEDMRENFAVYPKKWGLPAPDTNIDHRRVPNLQTFFTRKGKSVEITENSNDYKPGDVVSWILDDKGTTHIGLVSHIWSKRTKRYLIIHNIGSGARAEDCLFNWKVTGHYRYF